jgi:hypothetical protein
MADTQKVGRLCPTCEARYRYTALRCYAVLGISEGADNDSTCHYWHSRLGMHGSLGEESVMMEQGIMNT